MTAVTTKKTRHLIIEMDGSGSKRGAVKKFNKREDSLP
jgi:hypothetical protein